MGQFGTMGAEFGFGAASSLLDFGLGMAADAFSRQQDWLYQKKAMDLQYNYDQKAANAAFQRDVDMFNIENQYNSPAQQLARLKSAGLSPALMQGGASQVAGQMGGSATPSVNANFNGGKTGIGAFMGSFMQNVAAFKQLGLIDAQTDEMLQRVVSTQLSDFIKKMMGKEDWMRIRDKEDIYGFDDDQRKDLDKFFGLSDSANILGESPAHLQAENIKADTQQKKTGARLNQAKESESQQNVAESKSRINIARQTLEMERSLNPYRRAYLDAQTASEKADAKKAYTDAVSSKMHAMIARNKDSREAAKYPLEMSILRYAEDMSATDADLKELEHFLQELWTNPNWEDSPMLIMDFIHNNLKLSGTGTISSAARNLK